MLWEDINMSRVRKVYSYDLYGKYKDEYDSLADASRKLGLHREGIRQVCIGERHRAGDFMFRYEKEKNIEPHPSKRPYEKCSVEWCYSTSAFREPQYCMKHYHQMRDNGRILRRSKFDPNGYEVNFEEEYVKIFYYSEDDSERPSGYFLIDLEDFGFVRNYTWSRLDNGREGYVYRRVMCDNKMSSVYLHRELMGLTDEELTVDHIDGDGLNNRKSNLRIVTQQGNNRNRRGNPKNYYYNKKDGKWAVNLSINNKTVYFGSYETEEEAEDEAKRVREKYYVIEEF